jgi:SAM-dependent methyltransferase
VTPTGEYRPSLLPLYNTYESTANLPVYLGQLEPIRAWLRGLVLDVACNFGRLSGLSPTTVSLDAERTFLLRGIELEKIRRPVRGSVASMPFRTGSFDTVLAIGVIEHVPRRHASTFLDELTRVTSSHGRLIICVMPKISLFVVPPRFMGRRPSPVLATPTSVRTAQAGVARSRHLFFRLTRNAQSPA